MKVCSHFTIAVCVIGFLIPFTNFSTPLPAPKDSITNPAKSLSVSKQADLTVMSKTEMVLQLALTVSQLVGTISGLVIKSLAQGNPRQFDPKKMEKIGEFLLGFDQLLIKINDLQAQQVPLPGTSQTVEFRKLMSLQNQCRVSAQSDDKAKEICARLSCADKAACTRAIMRDLIGYSYSANGKTVKVKGVISEMLKVVFIGYKDKEGKKHQSMFELLADLTSMPVNTKTEIMQAVRTAKRILKLVSQLTFVEPKVAQQEKEENKEEQAIDDEKQK
jgi:hypothetical protein